MTETVQRPDPESPQLLRALGPLDGVTIVVGTIIGSGIFLKPAIIATHVPYFGGILLVWIVSGILSLAGALAYAELAAMMPRAGGQYVYLRQAYGPFIAFLFGWTEFLVNRPGGIAALATACATYFSQLYDLNSVGRAGFAILALCLLSLINYRGVRLGGQVQTLFTIAKVSGLAGIIIGALFLGKGGTANFAPWAPASLNSDLVKAFGMAMIGALWAYDGWGNAPSIAEEIRDPQRNLPRCLVGGTALVMAIYLSANLAYHYVLAIPAIQSSERVAATVATALIGTAGATLIAAAVMCSTFGAANGSTLTGARLFFDMSRSGSFFAALSAVHPRFRTPHVSIVVQGACACALIIAANLMSAPALKNLLPSWMHTEKPVFDILTECVIVISWIFYALTVGAVFILRRKLPDVPRPYRCWGYPIVPLMFVVMAIWFVGNALQDGLKESVMGFGIMALGVPAYRYFKTRHA